MIEEVKIWNFFTMMNASNVRYILLKNVGNKLPYLLKEGNDVDILVHPDDRRKFIRLMKNNAFLSNPYYAVKKRNNYVFLYPMYEGDWFIKDKLIIEVFYQINVHALSEKTVLPLDSYIVGRVWEKRKWDAQNQWYTLDEEIVIIMLEKIFFKFTPKLVELIKLSQYKCIVKELFQFCNY